MSGLQPAVTLSEAQAYLRLEIDDEEPMLSALIRTTTALCETFINQVLIARDFTVDLQCSRNWQRLSVNPVRSITSIAMLANDGSETSLPAADYEIDVDASGSGWVRVTMPAAESRIRVRGTAGLAATQSDVPEPIRQGVLRLVAHMFEQRDRGGGQVPAAVTALWRPYRRMVLA